MKAPIAVAAVLFFGILAHADQNPPTTQPARWVWDAKESSDFAIAADICSGDPVEPPAGLVTNVVHNATTQPASADVKPAASPTTQAAGADQKTKPQSASGTAVSAPTTQPSATTQASTPFNPFEIQDGSMLLPTDDANGL